jgi:hypothetical protein
LALRVIRGAAPFWSLSADSGHCSGLARDGSVANDHFLSLCVLKSEKRVIVDLGGRQGGGIHLPGFFLQKKTRAG